ncbi:hypothetical protein UFOVP136_39 [uncultured Caudovirales phage]|uniref:Uncharacterized protein n=1 Tax=uncultured Caudovirales phage TaxID=2100421 RepID=A0A6J5LGN8_9CAUD|nr:hypothetical protein UFOVP136_39 [uncultured Caudovirales phage]
MLDKQIALENGLKILSEYQRITFERYDRVVLPADGFIFWVRTDRQFTVDGSFHYAANNVQENTQVYGKNYVTFTTTSDIDDFNDIGESELFIGMFDDIQFSFSQRGKFYRSAGLFHYTGEAINPIMRTQIIDDVTQLKTVQIVNDSLPIFMSLNKYAPVYPAYRGLQNVRPPFLSVEITDSSTLQQIPVMDVNGNRDQLCKDTVEVTCYGLDNNAVLDYIRYIVIEQALLPFSGFGICNTPISKTVNIPQSELNVTANAKKIMFEINYYQSRTVEIAQQLIQQAIVSSLIPSTIIY